jgi:hypothetical protein
MFPELQLQFQPSISEQLQWNSKWRYISQKLINFKEFFLKRFDAWIVVQISTVVSRSY